MGRKRSIFITMLMIALIMQTKMDVFAGWEQDENGWCYRVYKDTDWYYKNTWAVIKNDNGISYIYCFDKDGYLRTNQTTPDGFSVNEDGVLIVESRALAVLEDSEIPSEEQWKTGEPYIGKWFSFGHSISLMFKKNEEVNPLAPMDEVMVPPFEVNIYRDDKQKIYIDIYEIKNGNRIMNNTYDFLPYREEKYVMEMMLKTETIYPTYIVNMESGEEIFYPSVRYNRFSEPVVYSIRSSPIGPHQEEYNLKKIPFKYYQIIE